MKLVTFAVAMAPFCVGDTRLVPDEVAARLATEEVLSDSQDWPVAAAGEAPSARKPVRPTLRPNRPAGTPDKRIAR